MYKLAAETFCNYCVFYIFLRATNKITNVCLSLSDSSKPHSPKSCDKQEGSCGGGTGTLSPHTRLPAERQLSRSVRGKNYVKEN